MNRRNATVFCRADAGHHQYYEWLIRRLVEKITAYNERVIETLKFGISVDVRR